MEEREMTYKTETEALAAKEAGEIDLFEYIDICKAFDKAKGPCGLWSGHDGLIDPMAKHPDADKEASDMVEGPSITARALAEEGRD
jgi:hypothetical protein